jgi:hypothetical protein
MARSHLDDLTMIEYVGVNEDRVRVHPRQHLIRIGEEELPIKMELHSITTAEGGVLIGDSDEFDIAALRDRTQQTIDVFMFEAHDYYAQGSVRSCCRNQAGAEEAEACYKENYLDLEGVVHSGTAFMTRRHLL